MSTAPLGYDYNDGGLNNQKLAFLGLSYAAYKQESGNRIIFLPRILSRDQDEEKSTLSDFSEIFYLEHYLDFCARWGIEVVDRPSHFPDEDRITRCGWNYFGNGTKCIHESAIPKDIASTSFGADFSRSLVPRVRQTKLFQEVCRKLFQEQNIKVMSQFRIERDWLKYSTDRFNRDSRDGKLAKNEDYFVEAERIVEKIVNTLGDFGGVVFASCDEPHLIAPKAEIAAKVMAATNVRVVWKSDVISPDQFAKLRPIDASLIDFELAKLFDTFVGLSRSTFGNMACFERFAFRFRDTGNDYIYNITGDKIRKRTDLGRHAGGVLAIA